MVFKAIASSAAILAASLTFPAHAAAPQAASPANPRPNIVIIFMDDMGYADIGVFGAKGYKTPNLDRLASEGCIYRNFHVAQPICSASRAGLQTGCYPNRIGINGALGPKGRIGISAGEMTLGELVRQRGYATAIFGKWHLGHLPPFLPTNNGYDEYFGLPYSNDMWPYHPDFVNADPVIKKRNGYPDLPMFEGTNIVIRSVEPKDQEQLTTWYTEHSVKFIKEHSQKPFLLVLTHNMPHVPLYVSDKFRGKSPRGLYGDVVEEIDWSVGQVMQAIKDAGIEKNTWVIFTSDNGPWLSYGDHAGSALPLREGKGTSWEGGTRVPCLMRWPGYITPGTESWNMIMTIDLFPTIASLIGAELPKHTIDGKDVLPLIQNKPGAKNPHSSYWLYYGVNELQSIISGDGRWKLVLPHTYRTLHGRPGGKGGKPVPYDSDKVVNPELYDIRKDMSETEDVSAAHPDIVKRLMAEADAARGELGDALHKQTGKGSRPVGKAE